MADWIRKISLNTTGGVKPQKKAVKKENFDIKKAESGAAANVCFKTCMENYMEAQLHKGMGWLG